MRAPIGIRIASRRKALGIAQAALARSAGISASYLNLIEANKRQVGGALLHRIAEGLGLDIDELTGEAEHRLIHELTEALSDPVLSHEHMGADDARRLVATTPEMASVIARLYRAYGSAVGDAEAYADRLRADPLLAQLLHQVLSGATAIRSAAEILTTIDDLSAEERQRFLGTISRETQNLGAVSQAVIGQFDQTSGNRRIASVRLELDDMIFEAQNYFPVLEDTAATLRAGIEVNGGFGEATMAATLERDHGVRIERRSEPAGAHQLGYDPAARLLWFRAAVPAATRRFQMARLIAELAAGDRLASLAAAARLTSETARRGAKRYLATYVAGAILFPYDDFLADARALRYDVDALGELYRASFEQIAHRLVTLRRPGDSGIPFGFLRADPAGRLSKRFPLPDLLLPSGGHACPLWAIYTAFRTPGQLVRQLVRFPDNSRFLFIARAVSRPSAGFADLSPPHSILLAASALHADATVYGDGLDIAAARFDVPVGPTCRLCTRDDCTSRQESPWTPGGEQAIHDLLRG